MSICLFSVFSFSLLLTHRQVGSVGPVSVVQGVQGVQGEVEQRSGEVLK